MNPKGCKEDIKFLEKKMREHKVEVVMQGRWYIIKEECETVVGTSNGTVIDGRTVMRKYKERLRKVATVHITGTEK